MGVRGIDYRPVPPQPATLLYLYIYREYPQIETNLKTEATEKVVFFSASANGSEQKRTRPIPQVGSSRARTVATADASAY